MQILRNGIKSRHAKIFITVRSGVAVIFFFFGFKSWTLLCLEELAKPWKQSKVCAIKLFSCFTLECLFKQKTPTYSDEIHIYMLGKRYINSMDINSLKAEDHPFFHSSRFVCFETCAPLWLDRRGRFSKVNPFPCIKQVIYLLVLCKRLHCES